MNSDKIFYSIAEVADKTDLPKYVIRFWETEFAEISPDRHSGRRYYRQADIDIILKVKDLLYKQGFTIKGAKKFLHDSKVSTKTKVYSDFKVDEEKGELKPIQENKILTRFTFTPPSEDSKVDVKKIIQKLSDIEDILNE
ncbi:MerR family transcriptional regulator [bacterium]|nr:MerR family transcriptional regulator [bacterium]